ncbi:DEP domain-containing protein 7-like isoform X2 [Poecilia reticulata]|uniref:DEP domain-containing protein 7-like isoform X2 n=1 Tax=Poecilia reticulata TaxID=8081 RepID=UPI0007EB8A12|nr:PREDICTED: DEP domain-containing protein 7-like isoform X2 [Poecilia reticulata]
METGTKEQEMKPFHSRVCGSSKDCRTAEDWSLTSCCPAGPAASRGNMASIRERAAALKLRAFSPAAAGVRTAQASSIWTDLIAHLRSKVTVKRRLVQFKAHSDCFVGSEAVDVLLQRAANATGLQGGAVSRAQVVCVCQALLQSGAFEAVGAGDRRQDAFKDSGSTLYRFTEWRRPAVEELERHAALVQRLFLGAPPRPEEPVGPVGGPSRGRQTDAALPQSLVNEVWQEQTLLRLLSLVELPLLEGVLQCSQSPTSDPSADLLPHRNPDLISNSLDRRILQALRDSQEDEWLSSALDCLDFLPDQQVAELSRELPRRFPPESSDPEPPHGGAVQDGGPSSDDDLPPRPLTPWRLLLFGSLVRHYGSRPPLLPPNMAAVYAAVAALLENGQMEKALEALQLCLKLLPPGCREELRRLLTFMAAAAGPRAPKLDKEAENRAAVMKAFSKAVLHSRSFPKEKQDLMLNFLLSNRQEVFKIPGFLHKTISEKLAGLAQTDGPAPPPGPPASIQAAADAAKLGTQQALLELLSSIDLDRSMAAKERRRLLRQFCSAHPEIFHQYFGDSAASQI